MKTPRPAKPEEMNELHLMVRELAEFEKIADWVKSTPDDLARAIFEDGNLEALVVEKPEGGGLAGFALFFSNFSSFTGKPGLWLEDLYVRPDYRGKGYGKQLLDTFISTAKERGCGRAEWSVLDWNQNAIDLYEANGAEILNDWRICRVSL
ncbi:MAG: GNAT family N-acetyltransferase [Verrucomicrobiota bacterium JB023]|nr:GNAT family N-acetyltransferase [Verrucomicrobiota bacterium JB023]